MCISSINSRNLLTLLGWCHNSFHYNLRLSKLRNTNNAISRLYLPDRLRYSLGYSDHQIPHLQDSLLYWNWFDLGRRYIIRHHSHRNEDLVTNVRQRILPNSS